MWFVTRLQYRDFVSLNSTESINPFWGCRLGDLVFICLLASCGKTFHISWYCTVCFLFYILTQLHLGHYMCKSRWPHADRSLAGRNNHSSGGFQAFTLFYSSWEYDPHPFKPAVVTKSEPNPVFSEPRRLCANGLMVPEKAPDLIVFFMCCLQF